jgi:ABC-type multidrug transport system fused ATPase/permease subunit
MASKLMILMGVVILAYLAVDEWTRRGRPALRRGEARLSPWLNWRTFVPVFIALLLALLMARPFTGKEEASPPYLISAYVVAVGALVSWYQARRAERAVRARLDKQVADLVMAFRSTYQLQPAIFSTLEEARGKVDQPLRGWVTSTVQVFNVTSAASRALAKLRKKADNPYLHQFVYILEMSDEAEPQTVVQALEGLADRLRRHEELRNKTETEMGAITGQTRVIQLVSLGAIFIIAVISGLRSAYSSQTAQLFFIGLVSIAVTASYYIDQRILSLKEKIT